MLYLGHIEILYQQGRRRELALSHSPFSIGRIEGSDLVLSDRTVSKQHAQLVYHGGTWQIVDLGSANGTYVAGRRLVAHEPEPLADGAAVRVGSNTVVLHLGSPKIASAQPETSEE